MKYYYNFKRDLNFFFWLKGLLINKESNFIDIIHIWFIWYYMRKILFYWKK